MTDRTDMTDRGDSAGSRPRGPIRVFVMTLAQMLLFGIVGPIFLVMYFVIDEPDIGWMLYWGIGVTAIDVVLAVVISAARLRTSERMARFEASGVRAEADVIAVEQTGVQVNDQPVVRMSLRIHGEGIAPFEASTKAVVPLMSLAVVGARRLAVVVMPGTEDFIIDWGRSAELHAAEPTPLLSPSESVEPEVPSRSVGERLAELEDLRVTAAITDVEYASMRARILESL